MTKLITIQAQVMIEVDDNVTAKEIEALVFHAQSCTDPTFDVTEVLDEHLRPYTGMPNETIDQIINSSVWIADEYTTHDLHSGEEI